MATPRLRVLVTGAAGQVGEPLAIQLRKRGHYVYGLIRNPEKGKNLLRNEVKIVVGSIDDPDVLVPLLDKVDVIINAAAQQTNPNMEASNFNSITEGIRKVPGGEKKKVVFITGGMVYGGNPLAPLTEDAQTTTHPHFTSIIKNELDVIHSKDFHGIVARIPFVLGGDRGHWTTYFDQAATGTVKVFGNGNNVISYIHIDDLVDAFIAIAEADTKRVQGQIFNIAEYHKDQPVSQNDIALAFARGAGHPNVKLEYIPWDETWKFFDINVWVDSTKFEKAVGWKARHNVVEEADLMYLAWKELNKPGSWY